MIKDERNFHQRLQEFCDCFMETEFEKELEQASKGFSGDPTGDPDELALKFFGLAILHGANEDARKFSLQKTGEGKIHFSFAARGSYQLPPPALKLADRIFAIARAITHMDKDRGKEVLSMGLRNDRMELTLEFDRKEGEETLTVLFPAG